MDFIWWLRGRFFITFFPVRSSIWLNNGNILTAATFLPQSRCHCSFEEELLSLRAYRGNFAQTAEDLSFQSHLKAFRTVAFHQLNWGNVARRYHCRLIQRWRSPFLSEKSVLKISYIWLLSENQRTRKCTSLLHSLYTRLMSWNRDDRLSCCRTWAHIYFYIFVSFFPPTVYLLRPLHLFLPPLVFIVPLWHFLYLFLSLQSTPLHLAAGYNRVRIVQLLLQHGADVHAKDKGYVQMN